MQAIPRRDQHDNGPISSNSDAISVAAVLSIVDQSESAPQSVKCPRCQGVSSGGGRFCKYCGSDLSGVSSPGWNDSGAPSQRSTPLSFQGGAQQASGPSSSRSIKERAPQPAPTIPGTLASPTRGVESAPEPVTTPGAAPAASVAAPAAQPAVAQPGGAAPRPAAAKKEPVGTDAAATLVDRSQFGFIEEQNARLVVLVEDGSEGRSFDLLGNQVDIGRTDGDILLADDPFVSPRHARLIFADGAWSIRDLSSTNGVYIRIQAPHPLENGDLILLGLQVLQFQPVSESERATVGKGAMQHGTRLFGTRPAERFARLEQRTIEGVAGDVYHLFREETFIGREIGDLVFTNDQFLSRRHAVLRSRRQVREADGAKAAFEFSIEDLGSSNGTYVRIRRDTPLKHGDRIRVGQYLFRLDVAGDRAAAKGSGLKWNRGEDPTAKSMS